MDFVTLTEEWWADREGNPVPFGDPRGASVLYGIGSRVPVSVAESLNALRPKQKALGPEQVENKAIEPGQARRKRGIR